MAAAEIPVILKEDVYKRQVIMMLPGFAFSRQEADAFLDFNLSRIKKAKTPICYHLDHGASVEDVYKRQV